MNLLIGRFLRFDELFLDLLKVSCDRLAKKNHTICEDYRLAAMKGYKGLNFWVQAYNTTILESSTILGMAKRKLAPIQRSFGKHLVGIRVQFELTSLEAVGAAAQSLVNSASNCSTRAVRK